MDIVSLQKIASALPGFTEDVKWGNDLVFSVGAKMFAAFSLSGKPVSGSYRVPPDLFEEEIIKPGFKPAPYLARHHWVWVDDINRLSNAEWEKALSVSYSLVAAKLPARLRKQLGLEP